jgi:hypothetical protein
LFDPCVLQFVGVLELVNQDVTKAPAVMFTDGVVIAQKFIRAQHQLAKINHALALALGFVEFIQLYFFTGNHLALYQGKTTGNSNKYMNVIILRDKACTDGMSNKNFSFTALVLSGNNLYQGCCE